MCDYWECGDYGFICWVDDICGGDVGCGVVLEKVFEGGGCFVFVVLEEEVCVVGEMNFVWDLRVERMNFEVFVCIVVIVGRGVGVLMDIEIELFCKLGGWGIDDVGI